MPSMTEMTIEWWDIERVKPYEHNARTLSPKAVDKVAASLREFGWRQPIVVDREGVIVCGHTRLLAAQKLGMRQVPVHVATDLTPAQIKAYRLADNRTNQETDWNLELLAPEISDLRGLSFDLSLIGFDTRELDALLTPDGDAKANACPDVPVAPVSRVGDLWRLGPHRVLCGDSTAIDATSRLLGEQKAPFIMVTDPPYGVDYDPSWRVEVDGGGRHAVGKVANDDQVDWSPAFRLFPGDVAYVWHAGVHAGEVAACLAGIKFQIRAQIVWRKQHFVMSRGHYHWGHEPCFYAVREGKPAHWNGDRTQSTVWDVPNANPHGGVGQAEQTGHGTQKPVEIMRRPILNHTERGAVVYDPFLGSGTTLIAAQTVERICYGLEIDPRYVDVICQRFRDFTGEPAILDGTGATFEHVREGRRREADDAIMEEALERAAER